jgi:hypothetical protein
MSRRGRPFRRNEWLPQVPECSKEPKFMDLMKTEAPGAPQVSPTPSAVLAE